MYSINLYTLELLTSELKLNGKIIQIFFEHYVHAIYCTFTVHCTSMLRIV